MLVLGNNFESKPVASIQSGHRVAVVTSIIIDPRNLMIFAFRVEDTQRESLILHSEDVRNVDTRGIIIDNNDQLMEPDDDLVRLQDVLNINFVLLGKNVFTEDGKKLGKVSNFVVDTDDFLIRKLHIARSLTRSMSSSELIIDRKQVVQVTDDRIVVASTAIKAKETGLKQIFFGSTALGLETDQIDTK